MSAVLQTEQNDAPRQQYGRIETYVHSDSITSNKGAAMVRVMCDSEAGSRTQPFISFCKLVAKYAYAGSATCWFDIAQAYPEMTKQLNDVRLALNEDVFVTLCVVMTV